MLKGYMALSCRLRRRKRLRGDEGHAKMYCMDRERRIRKEQRDPAIKNTFTEPKRIQRVRRRDRLLRQEEKQTNIYLSIK